MANRKRNLNMIRRRQRRNVVRSSKPNTSKKNTEGEDNLIANNMADAVADVSFMLLSIMSLALLIIFLYEINR